MSLSGNIASLTQYAADLRRLPTVAAQRIATEAAVDLTTRLKATFAAGTDAYGGAWTPGADGKRVTLRKSGGLADGLFFVAIGTRIRMRLGVPWAKYQIGRRPVAPKQGAALPTDWVLSLKRIAVEVCKAELGR